MGKGGGPDIPDVQVPTISDVYGESVSASLSQLPRLLAAFGQYGPQYAQSIADIFINQQKRLKEAYPEQYGVLSQYSQNLTDALKFIGDAGSTGIPEPILASGRNLIRSGQAARGIATSPISAVSEAVQLAGVGEQYRQNISSEALQYLNTPPLLMPGGVQSLATLGIPPATPEALTQLDAQYLVPLQVQNQYEQFALQQEAYNRRFAQQQQMAQMLGFIGGPFAGGIYGGSSGLGFGQGFGYGLKGSVNALQMIKGGTYF